MLYRDIPLSLPARSYMCLQTKSASCWDTMGKAGLYKHHTFTEGNYTPEALESVTLCSLLTTYPFQYCAGCSALCEAE